MTNLELSPTEHGAEIYHCSININLDLLVRRVQPFHSLILRIQVEKPFAAYSGDAPYIFVSYSHKDSSIVYKELIWLHDLGFNVWYDEGIAPGTVWRDELGRALAECSVFLYFITPQSTSSVHCVKEVNFALGKDKHILSIHLEETELPVGLEFSLSDMQAVYSHQFDGSAYRDRVKVALESLLPQQALEVTRYDMNEVLEHTPESTQYAARDPGLNREVTVIALDREVYSNHPELGEALLREMRVLAVMDDVRIVTIYDIGEMDGAPFVVTQMSKGTTLDSLIRKIQIRKEKQPGLSPRQTLSLVRNLAIIFNLLDQKDIDYQIDLRNFVVHENGNVQLTGLGLFLEAQFLVRFGDSFNPLSVRRYLSPEEFHDPNFKATPTSRVYSLGMIYMEIFSGLLLPLGMKRSDFQLRITDLPVEHQDLLIQMFSDQETRIPNSLALIRKIDEMEPQLHQLDYGGVSELLDLN